MMADGIFLAHRPVAKNVSELEPTDVEYVASLCERYAVIEDASSAMPKRFSCSLSTCEETELVRMMSAIFLRPLSEVYDSLRDGSEVVHVLLPSTSQLFGCETDPVREAARLFSSLITCDYVDDDNFESALEAAWYADLGKRKGRLESISPMSLFIDIDDATKYVISTQVNKAIDFLAPHRVVESAVHVQCHGRSRALSADVAFRSNRALICLDSAKEFEPERAFDQLLSSWLVSAASNAPWSARIENLISFNTRLGRRMRIELSDVLSDRAAIDYYVHDHLRLDSSMFFDESDSPDVKVKPNGVWHGRPGTIEHLEDALNARFSKYADETTSVAKTRLHVETNGV